MFQHSSSPRCGGSSDKSQRPKIPYKLLQLTSCVSHNELWDHRINGETFHLNAFCDRIPLVSLNIAILKRGLDQLHSSGKTVECSVICELNGNDNTGQCIITVHPRPVNESRKKSWNTFIGTIEFIDDRASESSPCFNQTDLDHLKLKKYDDNVISISRLASFRGKCHANCHGINSKFNSTFSLAVLAISFMLDSISPVPIIHTALSKGLIDPAGNCFLHGQPKTGFVALDDIHRALLVLDSDPKLSCLPVFGVWISGIHNERDPFVWSACVRYFSEFHGRSSSKVQNPFLVIIYKKGIFTPTFFDCRVENHKDTEIGDELDVFQSSNQTLSEESFKEAVYLKMERKCCKINPAQCLKMTSTIRGNKTENRRLGRLKVATPNLSDTMCDRERSPTPLRLHVHTPESPKRSNEIFEFKSPQNDLVQSPPPNELYNLIKAQEEQLNLLRAQLNCLLQSQVKTTVTPKKPAVETMSASTMTSLVWTPVTGDQHKTNGGSSSKAAEETVDYNATPEIIRRDVQLDASLSPMERVEESMANLSLATFTGSATSSIPSIKVDLKDFTHSFTSLSAWPLPSPDDTGTNENPYDESFYDSLLNKIQKILCEQTSRDCDVSDKPEFQSGIFLRTNPNQKSIFDSMIIPRLNYVTLFPSEMDNDYSMEFKTLTDKYFNNNISETSSDIQSRILAAGGNTQDSRECGLSYASQQYLKKYGLGILNANESSIN